MFKTKFWQLLLFLSREGNGSPLHHSCLANPMDRGAWWAAVHGIAKSRTRLSDLTFSFHFHALEKAMAAHSSVPAWKIPGTGSLVGCRLRGRTESDTRKRLSSSSCVCVCVHARESGVRSCIRHTALGGAQDGEPREGHCTNCFSFPFSGEPRGARAHVRGTHFLIPDVSWEPGEVGTHRQTAGSPCRRSDLGP